MSTIYDKLSSIGNAIREKTGGTELLTLDQMATEITNIEMGTDLNFEVVGGTTQPASPSTNTIWINTSTDISSYMFDCEAPSSPKEGMVWIPTGTSSDMKFNALNANGIQVYPLLAKQYISGAWVVKAAKIYQSGKWVTWWAGELYNAGTDYTDVTGGWKTAGLGGTAEGYSYNAYTPTLTKGSTTMTAKMLYDVHYASGIVRTTNAIPLKYYNTLNFTGKGSVGGGYVRLLVLSTSCTKFEDATATAILTTTSKTYTIDVSGLSDSYYIALMVAADDGATSVTCTINKLWLT